MFYMGISHDGWVQNKNEKKQDPLNHAYQLDYLSCFCFYTRSMVNCALSCVNQCQAQKTIYFPKSRPMDLSLCLWPDILLKLSSGGNKGRSFVKETLTDITLSNTCLKKNH